MRDRDNNVVLSQVGAAGSERAVGGQGPWSLVIGYAPGVKLFWRGQSVDLLFWRGQSVDLAPHTKGEVARLVLE